MKTAKLFKQVIEKIAAHHEIDLDRPEAWLQLSKGETYDVLNIERNGGPFVSVSHTFVQNGDVMRDPELVFFTGYGEWIPVSITQHPVGVYREVTWLDRKDGQVVVTKFAPKGQAELCSFASMWARNLRAQNWTDEATVTAKE